MKTTYFQLASATCLLSAATSAFATPAQTPNATVQHDFGALTSGFTDAFTDSLGGTNYHAYYFELPTSIEHANGSFVNIQTRFTPSSPPFDYGFGVDTVIGLYNSSGQKILDDDEGNTIDEDGDPEVDTAEEALRQNFSMLTFGNSDPLGDNPDATPLGKRPGVDGTLSAGTYTVVVFPFDGSTLALDANDHATLPQNLGTLDGLGFDAGGPLSGDQGDYTVEIAYQVATFDRGDFNDNGVIDEIDVDLLAANDNNDTDSKYDLDGDGTATFDYNASGITSDSDELIRNILDTEYGDANLSQTVSIGDLSLLAQHFGQNGVGWRDGDFNGDQRVSIGDLSILAQKFGFSGLGATAAAVPEPQSAALALAALLAAMHALRLTHCRT